MRPTGVGYANVMATVAVFIALGGGAYAALGKNSVDSKQIATNAVGSKEISKRAVGASEVQDGSVGAAELAADSITTEELTDGSVDGGAVADGSIGPGDLGFQEVFGSIRDGTSNTLVIGEGSIGAPDIGAGEVRGSNGNDGSSNTIHIQEGSVGSGDLGNSVVGPGELLPSLGHSCPVGTRYFQAACIETANREPATFDQALATCAGLGRWLPDPGQLRGFGMRADVALSGAPWEWAEGKYYDADTGGSAVWRAPAVGEGTAGGADAESVPHRYRCVAPALGT